MKNRGGSSMPNHGPPAVRTPQDWIIESERLAIKMISINFIKVTEALGNYWPVCKII